MYRIQLRNANAKTFTVCGTPEYMAPELVTRQGHSFGVDFWACGILLHEMLTGMPPFYSENPMQIYQKVCNRETETAHSCVLQITTAKIEWQKMITKDAKSVMQSLLERNSRLRLNSWTQLLKHPW